ncbi:sensor histidine kinase [Clostridium sp. HCS.1]|uniref:sensor histidine kinase n=1 Tax=Clostridium sp. HCS.1 TaxID=3238594 RepID=UPI003A0FE5A5
MDYNNFKEKIYYMNSLEILLYILGTSFIYCLFSQVAFFNKNMASDLLKLIELMVSIILLIFSIHIKSITQKKIYGIVKIFLIINCTIILVFLSPEGQFIFLKNLLNNIGYNSADFSYINIVIFYYMISKYRVSEDNIEIMHIEYIILIVISIIQINLLNKYNSWQIGIIHILFIFILIFITLRNTFKVDFNCKGKVDLIKLSLFIEIIRLLFIIISINIVINTISNFIIILMKIILISTMIGVISNVIKECYVFLFKEKVDTSNYLEDINRKIMNNNYKLEEISKKLSDNQMMYKSFLESLTSPIVIVNSNFRITYCNIKFLNEIGDKNIRNVINRRIDRFVDFNVKINKETCFGNSSSPYTTTAYLNDKKLEVRFFNLNNDDSEFILIFKDLTEEIKLLGMKEELQDIKVREEIKKNFLSNISHDLKIPINVIYSAIQLEKILIDKNDIEKVKSYNQISMENCLILTKLTNNIIDISKIDTENLEINLGLYNIVEFIEDYLFSLTPYINNSGLDIIFDTSEEEIYIHFDKEMMQRVILNLVSNSIKFTNSGGNIFVKIEDFSEYVLIELSDNGIGMNKEFISRAFNKYEMEKRNKSNFSKGFGVGLFVVHNLIKAQNGDIKLESEVGKGSRFSIKLYKKGVV